jgi:hypothetical protein
VGGTGGGQHKSGTGGFLLGITAIERCVMFSSNTTTHDHNEVDSSTKSLREVRKNHLSNTDHE